MSYNVGMVNLEKNCVYRALTEILPTRNHALIRVLCEKNGIMEGVHAKPVLEGLQALGVISIHTEPVAKTMSQRHLLEKAYAQVLSGTILLVRNNGETFEQFVEPGHLEAFYQPLTLTKELVLESNIAKAITYGGEIMKLDF